MNIGYQVIGSGASSGRTPYTPTTQAFSQTGASVLPVYTSTTALPQNGYNGQQALVNNGVTQQLYTFDRDLGWT